MGDPFDTLIEKVLFVHIDDDIIMQFLNIRICQESHANHLFDVPLIVTLSFSLC
jgi:hypothetical protein